MDDLEIRSAWDYLIDDVILSDGIIVPRKRTLLQGELAPTKLRAYNVEDGSVAWTYADAPNKIVYYYPILGHEGKLLVHIEERSLSETSPWGVGGFNLGPGPDGLTNFEIIGSETATLAATADSRMEVLDILTGDVLASKNLSTGTQSHVIMVPTGDPTVNEASGEFGVDVDAITPMALRINGQHTGAWSLGGTFAFRLVFNGTHSWMLRHNLTAVSCEMQFPPPHAIDQACVSDDGSFIVFPPSKWGSIRELSLSSGAAKEAVALPAPNGADDDKCAVAYDWDLNELWRSYLSPLEGGTVVALTNNRIGIGYRTGFVDGDRFRIVDADGETLEDRAGVGIDPLLATPGRLIVQRTGYGLQHVF